MYLYRKVIGAVLAGVAAVIVAGFASPASAIGLESPRVSGSPSESAQPAAMSSAATIASTEARTEKPKKQGCKRPNYIASFSNHALSEMQKDGITKEQARDVIESRGTKVQDGNSKCSWKVTKGKITVVINEDANVITAWRSR